MEFVQMFLQPLLAVARALAMFRELIAECEARGVLSIECDRVKSLLFLVPDKHPARQLVIQSCKVLLDRSCWI